MSGRHQFSLGELFWHFTVIIFLLGYLTSLGRLSTLPGGWLTWFAIWKPPVTRPFADPGKVQRMGPFDWNKYTPIIVEREGNVFTIQDGMTRVEAARAARIHKLPALIFETP